MTITQKYNDQNGIFLLKKKIRILIQLGSYPIPKWVVGLGNVDNNQVHLGLKPMETIAIQSLMAWFECKIQFRFVCLVTCSVWACRQIRKILNTQSGHRNWWRFSFYYGNHHLFSRTVRPWIIHIYDLPSTFKGTNKTVLNLRPMYDLQSALPTI